MVRSCDGGEGGLGEVSDGKRGCVAFSSYSKYHIKQCSWKGCVAVMLQVVALKDTEIPADEASASRLEQ